MLQWKPETEIEIVETILKGDTIEFATAFELMQRIEGAKTLSEMAEIVKDAFYCGMPKALEKAFQALQNFITGDVPINEIAKQHDGGGHPLASGANSYNLEENEIIYQKLKNLLKN